MKPTNPIPAWLLESEPVLASRAHAPLFESIGEAAARVRREAWRSSRGRRFLLYNWASPAFVFMGVIFGVLLINRSFLAAMILLYAVPISQIVMIVKRGKRSAGENLLQDRTVSELWLAGCRGSELVAAVALRFAHTGPTSSVIFALAAAATALGLCLGLLAVSPLESILFAAVTFAWSREMCWWATSLIGPLTFIHRARARITGLSGWRLSLWWSVLAIGMICFVGFLNHGVIVLVMLWMVQWGYSMAVGIMIYLMGLSLFLLIMRSPGIWMARILQHRWLNHIDVNFDGYVRRRILKDGDAERTQ